MNVSTVAIYEWALSLVLLLCFMHKGPLREIYPRGTNTDTGPPSFWDPHQNLHSLFV